MVRDFALFHKQIKLKSEFNFCGLGKLHVSGNMIDFDKESETHGIQEQVGINTD